MIWKTIGEWLGTAIEWFEKHCCVSRYKNPLMNTLLDLFTVFSVSYLVPLAVITPFTS